MAVKRVLTMATEEYVLNLIKELKEEFPNRQFDQLQTNDKTVLGSINELNELLGLFTIPEFDITALMYYGVINPEIGGNVTSFRDITYDMFVDNKFISTKPGERSLSLGYVEQGHIIVVAIPVIFDLIANKDNGFGGANEFDESVLGANGVDVVINDQKYILYGEFATIAGERKINIVKREPVDTGCECPPVTDADITDIINNLE